MAEGNLYGYDKILIVVVFLILTPLSFKFKSSSGVRRVKGPPYLLKTIDKFEKGEGGEGGERGGGESTEEEDNM